MLWSECLRKTPRSSSFQHTKCIMATTLCFFCCLTLLMQLVPRMKGQTYSCADSTCTNRRIYCSQSDCSFNCDQQQSCKNLTVYAPNDATNEDPSLQVDCTAYQSCESIRIYSAVDTDVTCTADMSCHGGSCVSVSIPPNSFRFSQLVIAQHFTSEI